MVDKALMSIEGWGNNPVVRMRSPSSTERGSLSWFGSVESPESWSISGQDPAEQISILFASTFRIILSWWCSSQQPEQQWGGHLDILTSSLTQSISGLWFRSQECLSNNFCFPRPVMANTVHSKWFLWQRIKWTTSVIEPASFGVPSMLYTGIGCFNLTKLKWQLLA